MSLKTIIVKWTGPHSLEDVCDSEQENGIYLFTGKKRYERRESIQYCGITERQFRERINEKHHKLAQIREDTLAIWLGEVIYPQRFNRSHLEKAEHCFIAFWRPPLNEKKSVYCPRNSICFISQWFTPVGEPRRNRPPIMNGLPDLLWWDEERWRTGKLKVWDLSE